MLADAAATLLALLATGSHVLVPWRLAPAAARTDSAGDRAGDRARDRRSAWALAALPLLLLAFATALWRLAVYPDAAIIAGFWPSEDLVRPLLLAAGVRVIAVLAIALVLTDGVLFVGWRRLEPAGWRLAAILAALALFVFNWAAELLRVGATGPPQVLWWLALACRCLLALGVGETIAPRPPRWALPAAIALGLYALTIPREVLGALRAGGWALPWAGAILLFGIARWLPGRLGRLALAGAAALASLFLAETALLTQMLPPLVQGSLPALPGAG